MKTVGIFDVAFLIGIISACREYGFGFADDFAGRFGGCGSLKRFPLTKKKMFKMKSRCVLSASQGDLSFSSDNSFTFTVNFQFLLYAIIGLYSSGLT